jgi:hypothetical protein
MVAARSMKDFFLGGGGKAYRRDTFVVLLFIFFLPSYSHLIPPFIAFLLHFFTSYSYLSSRFKF